MVLPGIKTPAHELLKITDVFSGASDPVLNLFRCHVAAMRAQVPNFKYHNKI